MSQEFVLFGVLFVALFMGMPIALGLGLSSLCVFALFETNTSLMILAQRMFVGSDNYVFMAVPFFMLSGELMLKGGISDRLIRFIKIAAWRLPAKLANVTTIASAFFGAISGSNPATVSAIGGMMVPAMVEDGYPKDVAAAIAASSGTLGVIIPPSIPMVIYGITASVSVPKLFIGGIIPGIILAILICCVNIFLFKKHNPDRPDRREVKQALDAQGITVWRALKEAIWALMMPVIILGGIYGGIFTPTEAAVISVFYSVIVSKYVYKELEWKDMPPILAKAAVNTGMILFVVAACSPFAWFMTSKGIPEIIATAILNALNNKYLLILAMNIILLFLGCFLDTGVIILLVTTIFLKVSQSIGVSALALGIIMVMNTSIGMITPPMAVNLYIATRISGCTIEQITKKILPYLLVELLFVFIISNFPGFIEWLPKLID